MCVLLRPCFCFFFFFNDTATTEIYTLSLHDALPICCACAHRGWRCVTAPAPGQGRDRKSTRLNSSHLVISYAVFCLKKKKITDPETAHPQGSQQPPAEMVASFHRLPHELNCVDLVVA